MSFLPRHTNFDEDSVNKILARFFSIQDDVESLLKYETDCGYKKLRKGMIDGDEKKEVRYLASLLYDRLQDIAPYAEYIEDNYERLRDVLGPGLSKGIRLHMSMYMDTNEEDQIPLHEAVESEKMAESFIVQNEISRKLEEFRRDLFDQEDES